MRGNSNANFRRKIVGERVMLMLPFNVVLVARVRGTVDPSEVAADIMSSATACRWDTCFVTCLGVSRNRKRHSRGL